MKLKPGWTEDETGLWWARPDGSRRARGRWATCVTCSALFPSLVGNPGKYCSRQCFGRATGGSNRNSRPGLFVHWTPEECWLAGLLWADGCLSVDRNKRAVLLNITDEEVIAEAARIIGCRYGTYEQHQNDGYQRKPLHRLRFGARDAVNRLAAIGFDQPKLTSRPFPALPHPNSFLRGLFDGDGSAIWHQQGGRKKAQNAPLRLHCTLAGSEPCLRGVQEHLTQFGITPKKIGANGAVRQVQWNHYDSLRLAQALYADPGPCMSRKRSLFQRDQIQLSRQVTEADAPVPAVPPKRI